MNWCFGKLNFPSCQTAMLESKQLSKQSSVLLKPFDFEWLQSHFIVFGKLREIYGEQVTEKGTQMHTEIVATSINASVEHADIKTFLASGCIILDTIEKNPKNSWTFASNRVVWNPRKVSSSIWCVKWWKGWSWKCIFLNHMIRSWQYTATIV